MTIESRPHRARRLAANLAVLAVSSAVFLLLAEALVRRVAPQSPSGNPRQSQPRDFYAPHPVLGFTMNPGFHGRFELPEFDTEVRFSSIGLRDREYGPKPPGASRLLVLGDSYTFGWGVEEGERFADRLERKLDEAFPHRWEVVKAGTNAYATTHERAWMNEYGWALDPDLVVLEFCMGNDFADNRGVEYRVEDGYLTAVSAGPAGGGGLKAFLRRRSHLYLFARNLVKQPGIRRAERKRAEIEAFNALVDGGAAATAEALAGLAADAGEHGVPLVVAVVPMLHQVTDALGIDPALIEHPNRLIREIAAAAGLPVIDLLPVFRRRAAEGGPPLYFRRDPHWTREGHRVAGEALFDSLRAGGWFGR